MTTFATRMIRLATLAMVLCLALGSAGTTQAAPKTRTHSTHLGAGASSLSCVEAGDTVSCENTSVGISFLNADEVRLCVFVQRYGYDPEYYSGPDDFSCTTRASSIFVLDKKIDSATLQPQVMQLAPRCGDNEDGEPCPGQVGRTITIGATWTGVGDIEHRKANDKVESENCTYLFHSKGFHRQATTTIVLNGVELNGNGSIFGADDSMTVTCRD
jgi:hypothetical protein